VTTELALPRGFSLNEYRIEQLLGLGGFGLTYLATDTNLNLKVAIKEYLPTDWVERGPDQSVRSKSAETLETFNWGRTRFLEESRTLASFHHPNIVRVMRFFQANDTAYMVMEFIAGLALHDWLRSRRPVDERTVLSIALPLLDGLEVVHAGGYLHRDIKPGNIFIRGDGSPVLIDFGSARTTARTTEFTTIVSPGFAPPEQYDSRGGQGPWTDLYALGGVLYWVVTGQQPVDATVRAFSDPMVPALKLADRSRYSEALLKAIDWTLVPSKDGRPQSVAEFRQALRGGPTSTLALVPDSPASDTAYAPTQRVAPAAPPRSVAPARSVAPPPSAVPPPAIPAPDPQVVSRLIAELATHIGPIADKLVRSNLRKGIALVQVIHKLSAEITDPNERKAFVHRFASQAWQGSQTPATPSQHLPSAVPVTSGPATSQLRFRPEQLAKAEADLSQYIGAVARVVVKRAAVKARDLPELYLLLADEIEDPQEKKKFVRKAISAARPG
jgi:serine/threonine protein kinase